METNQDEEGRCRQVRMDPKSEDWRSDLKNCPTRSGLGRGDLRHHRVDLLVPFAMASVTLGGFAHHTERWILPSLNDGIRSRYTEQTALICFRPVLTLLLI